MFIPGLSGAFFIIGVMKQKLPAILFLISTGFSVVVYLKVVELSGHELLGALAAVGFYMAVFALLCVLFNTKEKDGEAKSTWQELKELQEATRKASEEKFAQRSSSESSESDKKES